MKRLEPFFSTTTWGHDGCEEREIHERPREDHNGGSEGVAGREVGGGVVGEPHSYFEKEQPLVPGFPDTDGIRQDQITISKNISVIFSVTSHHCKLSTPTSQCSYTLFPPPLS